MLYISQDFIYPSSFTHFKGVVVTETSANRQRHSLGNHSGPCDGDLVHRLGKVVFITYND